MRRIWVTNLRPRGKDFELALDARIDTGRWVEVSGRLQQGRGLQWLDATGPTIALDEGAAGNDRARRRFACRPRRRRKSCSARRRRTKPTSAVDERSGFSSRATSAPPTFKGHVRVNYDEAETKAARRAGHARSSSRRSTCPANRVLEIRFTKPLEVMRTVHIEIGEGILGMDQQPLVPWKLTFTTGEK